MSRVTKNQAGLATDLTAKAYDAVADPRKLDQFFAAWDLYMEQCLADERSKELDQLNDPAIHAHFQRGVELFKQIGRRPAAFDPQAYVDNLPGPALVLEGRGNVVARKLVSQTAEKPWRTLLDVPIDEEARSRIRQWIVSDQKTRSPFVFVPCFWDDSEVKTCLLAMEIDAPSNQKQNADQTHFLISSVDLAMDKSATDAFAKAYDLSEAEAKIAMLLSQGLAPEKIAKNRGVSINTIRSQLRGVLSKTNAWGIQDLVRLCCSFAAQYHQMQKPLIADGSRAPKDDCIRECIFELPDGRNLSYLDMGAPNGVPILFFHSMISGPFITPFAAQACARRGIRVIAPSAPGYGKSSPYPGLLDSEFVATFVSDAEMLLKHLQISAVRVLGHILGVVLAQRFARDYPDIAEALCMVGYATHFEPAYFDDMKAKQRIVGKTVLSARKALPFIVRASMGLLDTGDTAKMVKTIHDPNAFDQKDLRHPDLLEVVVAGIRHCVEQGPEPFCQYVPLSVTDWMQDGADVRCPVTLFHGEQDTMVTKKFFTPYVEAYPKTRLVCVEDGGKFLLYTHWEQILDAMLPQDVRSLEASAQ